MSHSICGFVEFKSRPLKMRWEMFLNFSTLKFQFESAPSSSHHGLRLPGRAELLFLCVMATLLFSAIRFLRFLRQAVMVTWTQPSFRVCFCAGGAVLGWVSPSKLVRSFSSSQGVSLEFLRLVTCVCFGLHV